MTTLGIVLIAAAAFIVGALAAFVGLAVWTASTVSAINARRTEAKGSKGE